MTQPDFIIIPYNVLIDKNLTPSDKIVYGVVYYINCIRREECKNNPILLSKLTKIGYDTIPKCLERLQICKYIKIKDDLIEPLLSFSKVIVKKEEEKIKEWVWESFLKGMDNHIRRDFQVIALYWKTKEIKFTNREQVSIEIPRLEKPAKELSVYEDEKIYKTMDWLNKNADFKWSLETVKKYINEDLKKLDANRKTTGIR